MSASSISQIIPEVCKALYDVLKDEYLSPPSRREQWKQIAQQFDAKWQFPHAVVAIDGKHINVQAPPNSGSECFNYKKFITIVLLAIADAKFISFDLGSPGIQSDSGIFKSCNLVMTCKATFFPQPCKLSS